MARRNGFIVSVFLVFIFALSGILCAQRVIDLDKVWEDMRVLGDNAEDYSGYAVAHGDINGDGYMDLIIGAYHADPGDPAREDAGETYVIFGSSAPLSSIDLSTQSADIKIYGAASLDLSGEAVASGDVNGDGYMDIIIGAAGADPGGVLAAGETYVIFGDSFSSPPYTIDLSTDSADITIYGAAAEDCVGWAVASEDLNGDAYDDLIIGAFSAEVDGRSRAGKDYVIFGKDFTPPVIIDLSAQTADITICGDEIGDHIGHAVASGDVNGDGFMDLIIGAPLVNSGGRYWAGETYVVFCSSFPTPPYKLDLNSWPADITICGAAAYDYSGCAVASGDVNGDGYDDLIIGAQLASPGGRTQAGETWVIFGSSSPPSIIDMSTNPASITVLGNAAGGYSGHSVASGNVNGDGYDDIIIGALGADPGGREMAGETYVLFGSSLSSPPYSIDLSTDQADITVCGAAAYDESGWSAPNGDVNGDGYDDLIIGAVGADPGGRSNAGETYLIAGGGAFITAHGLGGKSWIKQFSLLANGLNSFKAFGTVNSQGEVHLAVGDVDADRLDEIAAGQGEGGKSWVKFFEVNGSKISGFKAFGTSNTNGELHMTIGNFDADTSDNEIAIAQGEGGQSWVKTFETDGTPITAFKAFGAANAQGEVHLASGDLENADGIDEIIAGMGEGGSSRVKIFNYNGTLVRSFAAFDSTDNPGGEVRLAVGNFDADADLEVAASTGYNGGNLVRLFDKDGTSIGEFTAFGFGGNTNGDVQIAAADIDNDGIDELICCHGEGGKSAVKVFKPDGSLMLSFKAFGAVNAQGQVHLGRSNY